MKRIHPLCALTVSELSDRLGRGELTSVEITKAYLAAIASNNAELGAYLSVFEQSALEQAQASDARRKAGQPRSKLDGVPIAIKDNIMVKGEKCTCASRMLENFVAPYHATVTEQVLAAGLPILGKLNMDEFAMGSTTEFSALQKCHNPWDLSRVPGGSSGGAAAAVAGGLAPIALGSDTGGSIRQPASFCGVTGFKPAYGAVSRYGLVAFASSLDQIGPVARSAKDAAMLMTVLRGHDTRDATHDAALADADVEALTGMTLDGVTLGVPKECFMDGLSMEVEQAVKSALDTMQKAGARIVSVSVPSLRVALPAYYVLSSAEASSNLARYDGVRYGYRAKEYQSIDELYRRSRQEGFGEEVKRRILLGTFALSSGYQDQYYQKAQKVRALVTHELTSVLADVDALAFPVAPTVAYPMGDASRGLMENYLGDIYTVSANIAGLPAISTPIGLGKASGMPVGLSLMLAREKGAWALGIASALEKLLPLEQGAPYLKLSEGGED